MADAQAYVAGLKMLARRELSEAQLRLRLARRAFAPADIDDAVQRLRRERALDDRRVALACAREGADVAISYLPEEERDAEKTCSVVREAGKREVAAAEVANSRVDRVGAEEQIQLGVQRVP